MATPVPPSTGRVPERYRPKPPTPDLYEPDDYRETFKVHESHKTISKFSDPCARASKATLKCLEQTQYNRSECYEYFVAYRDKTKWMEQRKKDKAAGVSFRPPPPSADGADK